MCFFRNVAGATGNSGIIGAEIDSPGASARGHARPTVVAAFMSGAGFRVRPNAQLKVVGEWKVPLLLSGRSAKFGKTFEKTRVSRSFRAPRKKFGWKLD